MINVGIIGYGCWGLNVDQGQELVNIAYNKNLKIMVDHAFLFTGAVRKMR